jgi:hypothetical protein
MLGLAMLVLALAVSTAGAATIHACVNKRTGSVRFVGSKTTCRKSERRAAWSTVGPAGPLGPAGPPGAAGTPGTNGVGADYGNASFGLRPLEADTLVIAKSIPAGSYFVSAKLVLGASEAKKAVFVGVICELVDTPGTPVAVEFEKALDVGEWAQGLSESEVKGEFTGATTIQLQGQLTTTEPTSLGLVCAALAGSKEAKIEAFASQISALQTTANK